MNSKMPCDWCGDSVVREVDVERPLISVVIITWNRREDILETVQSVCDQAYEKIEVVVVDNGSTDGTSAALKRAFPAVTLVVLEQNMGVSIGRNAGIAVAQGEVVFFLDSDASLGYNTLTSIIQKFQVEPDLGIIACKIVNAYTKQLDYGPGWAFSEKDKADQDLEFLSYSFSEGGCAIRRDVFDKAGLFWDSLFFGREGEELSLRVWDVGYKIVYWPKAVVYHRVSPNKRIAGSERQYFDLRNSLSIYLVRYPLWMMICFVPLKICLTLVKGVRRGGLRDILRALLEVFRQVPALWRQRKPISNKTARYYLSLQREHGPLRWDLISWLKYKV